MAGVGNRFTAPISLSMLVALAVISPGTNTAQETVPGGIGSQRLLVEIEDGPVIGIDAEAMTRLNEHRASAALLPPATFALGRPATQDEIAAWDTDIMPDGTGLPEGSGSVADGERLYAAGCAACHGVNGEGNRPLGGALIAQDVPGRNIGDYWPFATTVYDYVQRAMPFDRPGSLTADEVYALTAWLLFRNGIISEETELDADSLPLVMMPNFEGFELDDREAYPFVR